MIITINVKKYSTLLGFVELPIKYVQSIFPIITALIFKYIYIQETKSNAIYSFTCLDPTLPKKITYHKFPITDVVLKVTKWYKAKHCYCEGNLFFQNENTLK